MKLNILNRESNTDRIVEIPGDEVLIGKNLECDLVLEGPEIDAQHVRIVRLDGKYYLKAQKDGYGDISPAYEPVAANVITQEVNRGGLTEHSDFASFDVGRYTIYVIDST